MSLRRSLGFVLVALTALGCSRGPTGPNVVLVVIDTLRADHVGSYGYAQAATPRLDALAARGTRFAAARATSSWTLPSVASILTGRSAVEHGAERVGVALGQGQVTLAEALAGAGYETAAFSANVVLVTPEVGLAQGFDRFDVLERPAPADGAAPAGHVAERAATADVVTDTVLAWLKGRPDPSRPYFLYVHYFDPHASYAPPRAYAERFGVAADDPLLGRGQNLVLRGKLPPENVLATLRKLYDAEIAFTDHEVGRLLDGLGVEREGAPGSIVVVTADHGEEFGDHGGMEHGKTLFDEVLRVPLLIAGTGLPGGRVVETPVSLVSIVPTLTELAGIQAPAEGRGSSLVSVLRGGEVAAGPVFATLTPPSAKHRAAAVEGTAKVILDSGFKALLFDVARDPGERTNIADADLVRSRNLQLAIGAHNKAGYKARGAAPPEKQTLDADRRERLRQLGYVE
jgi:arylsulfatase A-like enzyme